MPDNEKQKSFCLTCRSCMKVKEKNKNAVNSYMRCLHDPEIDCEFVIECNKHEGARVE